MSRKSVWRNTASDAVSSHQDQAFSTTMLLIRSYGPTAFLLREEGEVREVKVCLGDLHTCTCSVFTREQEPCKHICWVLLRKFRLPRDHEYSFQHGLVERQLLELLQGLHQVEAHRTELDTFAASGTPKQMVPGPEAGSVCRKVIQAQDVCPICQEELLQKKQPVSYCRFGCGNSVHISCMKVWADHQTASEQKMVRCPLCREDFGSVKLLQVQVKNASKLFTTAEREKPNKHLGAVCHSCRVCPIFGTCFRCMVCSHLYLCEDCVQKGCHSQHSLASRATRRAKWILEVEDPSSDPKGATSKPHYDRNIAGLPNRVLECLPAVRVRSGSPLLNEGLQCRICLQCFSLGQNVRILPCHHKFHVDCVDQILLETSSCPLDGFIIYCPLTWRRTDRKTPSKLASSKQQENHLQDLFVPGLALQVFPTRGALNLEVLTDTLAPLNTSQKQVTAAGEERRKQTPIIAECSYSLNHLRQNSCSRFSKQRPAKCSSVTRVGEQMRVNLFIGPNKQGSENTVTSARQLQNKSEMVTNSNGTSSELRLTGCSVNKTH